jgi:HlyD family secretion protein
MEQLKMKLSVLSLTASMALMGCGSEVGDRAPSAPVEILAAPGRVQAAGEIAILGTTESGVVQEIAVAVNQTVSAGQVLLKLDCGTLALQTQAAEARAEALSHGLAKLRQGSRAEELAEARAAVAQAKAELANRAAQARRAEALQADGMQSRATVDEANAARGMAEARLEGVRARLEMLEAGARREDIQAAAAQHVEAKKHEALLQRRLADCSVRAPFAGRVLRLEVAPGDHVGPGLPGGVLQLAPAGPLRVRAEIDERDVRRVRLGQEAQLLDPAGGETIGTARVVRLHPVMGRKRVLSGDPADKADRDVMEVELEPTRELQQLPVGYRVTVRINKAS